MQRALLVVLLGFVMVVVAATLRGPLPAAADTAPIASRISAYAPPTIPHEIFDMACLDCHASNEMGAPMLPHQLIANCRQCHIPRGTSPLFRENTFRSVAPPTPKVRRAYPGSPPVIPHRVFMREHCLACHDKGARASVISSPHPERANCLQCHVEQQGDVPLFRHNTNLPDSAPGWQRSVPLRRRPQSRQHNSPESAAPSSAHFH